MSDLRYTQPMQFKASGQAGVIEGYASTFSDLDHHGDIIAPGAFTKSLDEHRRLETMPAMYFSHNPNEVIGKWLNVNEDGHGLHVKGKLTLTVQRAQEAYALAKDGAMALSIGFAPVKKSYKDGANILEEVRLGEVSLVGMAANPRARITSIKSLQELSTRKEFETLMRDCFGLSSRQAKRLSMGGWKAYRGGEDVSELAEAIEASADRFRNRRVK